MDLPVVVTGALNVTLDSCAHALIKSGLGDTKIEFQSLPYSSVGTSAGFIAECEEGADRIDYVFVGDEVKVLRYGVLSDQNWVALSRSYRSRAPACVYISKPILICWVFV
jgi:endonuclease/exonuclease/phosphatase family metal-dependent hydrolase